VTEPTSFLYPFIDREERDADALLSELSRSAAAKMLESRDLTAATLDRLGPDLERAGRDMATRFLSGGRLLAFGNGGSATDARSAVDLFLHPPTGRPLGALALVADRAVLTALANDVGYELVFSRQIIAYGRAGDIATKESVLKARRSPVGKRTTAASVDASPSPTPNAGRKIASSRAAEAFPPAP
jgi:D-sedoheptulose 7-phosphate isomerase